MPRAAKVDQRLSLTVQLSDPDIPFEVLDWDLDETNSTHTFDVQFTGDGQSYSVDLEFVRAYDRNQVFGTIPVVIRSNYAYDVDAVDEDGDALTYALIDDPSTAIDERYGATIDPQTGLMGWDPPAPGQYTFTAKVTDGQGGSDVQMWNVLVSNPLSDGNPTFVTSMSDQQIEAGREFTVQLAATDPDNDNVAYKLIEPAPDGMTIDRYTGVITWTPDSTQEGA